MSIPNHINIPAQLCMTAKEGDPPTFSLVAYTGGLSTPKDFPCPVVVDLAGLDIPVQKIPVRFEHKSFQGVGHTEKIVIVGKEVHAEGIISRDTSWARDVATSGKHGFPWQASMGGPIHELEHVRPGETATANGQIFEGEIYIVRKMTLKEISFVDLGADENTTAIITSQFNEQKGFTMNNTTPPNTLEAKLSSDFEQKLMDRVEQKMIYDQRRIAAIQNIGGGKFPELEAQAIESGWAVEKFQGEYMAKILPDASKIPLSGTRKHEGGGLRTDIVECSFLQSAGLSGDALLKMGYDERTIDASTQRQCRGLKIQSLLRMAANDRSEQFSDTTIRMAYENMRYGNFNGSYSTVSIPGILSNVANKMLMSAYAAIDDPTPRLSKEINANDFKEVKLYTLVLDGGMAPIAPDGEIKHASLTETPYKAKLETRGAMLTISRETIINDDMGALADLFNQMGRKVILEKQKLWFKEFLSNISKVKMIEGNPSLSLDSLAAMKTAFDSLTDAAGDLILANGQFLMVPPKLWATASTLLKTLIVDSQTVVSLGTNPAFGALELLNSPYIGATNKMPGVSDTAFYMFTNPAAIAAMGTAYLKGNRNPFIETFDCDVNTLGMTTRCFFDYGVAFLDPNGVIGSKGTDDE